MTFIEAALAVLEREGRPMHAREIADRAVDAGLLSHVGKTPVQTMSARISAMVAKGRGKGPFVRVRPGVFGLAKWGDKPPGPRPQPQQPPPVAAVPPAPKPERAEEPAAPEARSEEPKAKRRRRSRGKKKTEGEIGAPAEPTAAPKPAAASSAPPPQAEEPKPRRRRRSRGKKKVEEAAPAVAATEPAPRQPPSLPPPPPPPAEPVQTGKIKGELTDWVEEQLRKGTKPIPLQRIAEDAGFAGDGGTILLESLLDADSIEREHRGLRPRFVEHRGGWALAEREVSAEIVTLERQVAESAARLSMLAERQLLRRLRALPLPAFVRVAVVFLRRSGFGEMAPVVRGPAHEFHLSVQDRRRGGRFRTAVVLRRDHPNEPVPDSAVSSLRGALHHYGAMSAMIITTGAVSERARDEAEVPNLAPVALVDGELLARELARLGVGVRERRVGLPTFDERFFTDLGD